MKQIGLGGKAGPPAEDIAAADQPLGIAGLRRSPQAQFMKLLGGRRIPLHYGVDDFENDLRTLQDLGRAKK